MMKIERRKTKVVKIGKVAIGGNNPIAVQSMVKTRACDSEAAFRQIKALESAGCEMVRLAIRDNADAKALKIIKRKAKSPIIADIHFDWRLALEAIDCGADKIRLNPGNIYKKQQIKEVALAAKSAGIAIRVGVNSGSLPKTDGSTTLTIGTERSRSAENREPKTEKVADRMVKAALDYIKILEGSGFNDIVVSLKASNIFDTIEAYRKMAALCEYPFHLGVTATGEPFSGAIKSGIAIGALLLDGIGDTVRISLTEEPQEEVKAAKCILEALNLRHFGPEIISCPTCGRCEVDLVKIVKDLENKLSSLSSQPSAKPMKLAVMGCVVNGPGEAKETDAGVAFGAKEGLLFKKGKPVKKISPDKCADVLLKEVRKFVSA